MKIKNVFTVLLIAFILASCTPAARVVSTETTAPISTFTPVLPTPSSTSVPPTSTPTAPIETLSITKKSVRQFASAMQTAGINVTAEQILQQGLEIQTVTGADSKQYEIATTHLDPNPSQEGEILEGDYPLMIKTEKGWEEISLANTLSIFGKETQVRAEPGNSQQLNALSEFSSLWVTTTSDGFLFPQSEGGTIDYKIPEYFVTVAKDRVVGGQLAWGYEPLLPQWLKNLSTDQLKMVALSHIAETMNHFYNFAPTKKYDWIIAAEAASPTLYTKKLGNNGTDISYIIEQYEHANAVMTAQKRVRGVNGDRLAYSDFINGITDNRLNKIIPLIKELKDRNLLDVFHLQLRYVGGVNLNPMNPPTQEDLTNLSNRIFAETGVPVIFTEIGIEGEGDSTAIFSNTINACKESVACLGVQLDRIGADNPNEHELFDYNNGQAERNSTYFEVLKNILLR